MFINSGGKIKQNPKTNFTKNSPTLLPSISSYLQFLFMLFPNILTSPPHFQQQSLFSDVLYSVHGHKIITTTKHPTKANEINPSGTAAQRGDEGTYILVRQPEGKGIP